MALTIKMLKDENKQDFIPFTTTMSVVDSATNNKLQNILDTKLEADNIKAGDGITIEKDGNNITVHNAGGGPGEGYILPTATQTILGGIKVGEGLEITNDGTLSVSVDGETYTETDPEFFKHVASSITQEDIDNWNAKPDNPGITSEDDPIFVTSPAYTITQNDIDTWNSKPSKDEVSSTVGDAISGAGYIIEEEDPIFTKSAAFKITEGDITNWNSKADVSGILSESDPYFTQSPAAKITDEKMEEWDAKLSTETDPIFSDSPAGAITQDDINNWNAKANKSDIPTDLGDLKNEKEGFISTETDPLFSESVASDITQTDIDNWNAKASLTDIPDSIKDFADADDYVTTEGLTNTLNNTNISTFNNDAGYYNELWKIGNQHASDLQVSTYRSDDLPTNTNGYAIRSYDPMCLGDIVRIMQGASVLGESKYLDPLFLEDGEEDYVVEEWANYEVRSLFLNPRTEINIGGGIINFRFGIDEKPNVLENGNWNDVTYSKLKEIFQDSRIICTDISTEPIHLFRAVGLSTYSNSWTEYHLADWWFWEEHRVYMDIGGYLLPVLLKYNRSDKKMSVEFEFFPDYIPDDFMITQLYINTTETVPFTLVSHVDGVHVYQPAYVVDFTLTNE